MGDIVEEMLLSAQLRAEPAQFGPVDLGAVAADVVEAYRPQAVDRDVSLDLAAGPEPATVRGVPSALRRAIAALVDNALGHVRAGGTVAVSVRGEPDEVICEVRDDGVGFDPAESDRMFDRFARGGHGEGRRFGLGLALVRETVEAHGGTVTADSEPGHGATFTVSLPAWDET
jgi:signal transduction histidine kinase